MQPPPIDDTPAGRQGNVLLVDDRPAHRLALRAALADPGLTLVEAASAEEALRRLADDDIAVVLLDAEAPGPGGYEAARLIRGGEKARRTPIVFLTAREGDRAWLERAYALGAVDHVAVPPVPVVLRAKVTACVELFHKARRVEGPTTEPEQRFRQLAESINEVFWMADPHVTEILYVSPAYERVWGRTCQSLYACPRSFLDAVHPEDRERVRVAALVRHAGGDPTDEEYRIVRPDGTVRWVRDRGFPVKDAAGRVYRYAGIAEDVTERKEAGRALRESEERFARFMQHLPGLAWIKDLAGQYVYANQATENAFGRPREGLYGKTDEDVFPSDSAAQFRDNDRRAAAGGAGVQVVEVLKHPDGTLHHSVVSKFPIPGSDGQPALIGGMAIDISDLKRVEAALRESESRLRHSERVSRFLAEASRALAGLTDYESTLRQVAWLAVPFFADWCAVDLVDPDGSLRRLAVAHADPDKLRLVEDRARSHPPSADGPRGIPLVLRTGQPDLMEHITDALLVEVAKDEDHLRLLRALGLTSSVCVPLQVRGRTLGVLTLATAESGRRYTRTDLALAEDLARRAAVAIDNARLYHDLREADRKKDEFLATLAHELRNPLAPIRNTLAILKMKGASAAVVGQAREMMERQLNHLVRLVDDLMDVSRIMRGKIALKKDAVDLATVVARAAEIANPMIDAQGHHLTIALPPEPLRVEGDEIRLAQVVANLLNNAGKYADRPGRVWLTGRREGGDVVLRVKDQGIGIAAEMLPRVFDLFVQAARSGERTQGGLGIGLSLCQRLVEMHGGTITAHSEGLGRGSEFVVRLPALPWEGTGNREQGTEGAAPSVPSVPRRRVLCVDDNIDACTSLALMVRLHHHDVETAHDGLAALEKAATFRPDLTLLDIGLPGLNGYEVCRRLREQPDLASTFIVALTGWGQDEDRRRSHEAGFDLHVTKPIDPQLLEDLLRRPPGR